MAGILVSLICTDMGRTDGFGSLGHREDTIIHDGARECSGALVYNHDFSFENGYCWSGDGIAPPYYGAIAEGFDLGSVTVECGVFWLTTTHFPYPPPADVYIWDGGVEGAPGDVLCMISGVDFRNIPLWPSCGQNEVEIECCVHGDFTIGYWVDFSEMWCDYYCCADESGTIGYPWMCIMPGIGYPGGWQHPNVVWPDCSSMGIGVTVTEDPSLVESWTWGGIRSLFRE
jgi:hypothetical protein